MPEALAVADENDLGDYARAVPAASPAPAVDDSLGDYARAVPSPLSTEAYTAPEENLGDYAAAIPKTPTSESEKALAETPKVQPPPQVQDIFDQSIAQQNIESTAPDKAPQWLQNAADAAVETVGGFVPKTAGEVVHFLTPAADAVDEVKKTYGLVRDVVAGKPLVESERANFPESFALVDAEQTPPFSKERFKAGFGVLAQMGMLAAGVKGIESAAALPEESLPVETLGKSQLESLPQDNLTRSETSTDNIPAHSIEQPALATSELPLDTNLVEPDLGAAAEAQPTGVASAEAAAPPIETTGVANRVLQKEAKAGKIGEVDTGEGMSWQEMVDLGREQLNKGADPGEIARRFKRNQRISPTDFAVLRAERERLAVESNKAADAARANPEDPVAQQALTDARKSETDWVRDVVQPAKTSTSDIFRGMQGEAPIDATTFEGLRRAAVDASGKEPSMIEKASIERKARSVRQASEAESAALKKMSEKVETALPKTRTPKIEDLRAEIARMVEELTPCK